MDTSNFGISGVYLTAFFLGGMRCPDPGVIEGHLAGSKRRTLEAGVVVATTPLKR
ncbi:MAG: hypothetical protein ABR903_02745 [Thermodesulfovibrionales bacterium]|jgi:hypothetical protein